MRKYLMRTMLSQRGIKQFAATALAVSLCSATTWAAPVEQAPALDTPALMVPGYGPGIAGHIIEGPTTPRCLPLTACTKPVADATVLIVDRRTRDTVGTAVTNASGNFIVTVPHGIYLVRVESVSTFPRCPQASDGGPDRFHSVQITCDSGIR
jgi:hypothetical protein